MKVKHLLYFEKRKRKKILLNTSNCVKCQITANTLSFMLVYDNKYINKPAKSGNLRII